MKSIASVQRGETLGRQLNCSSQIMRDRWGFRLSVGPIRPRQALTNVVASVIFDAPASISNVNSLTPRRLPT